MTIKYATAGTVENIKRLIAEFYYSQPEKITLDNDGAVYNNGRKLSTKVEKIKNRFVFGY